MPAITNYQASDAFVRLLLQGPPGTAKTSTACQFPKAWVFDLDRNLGGPLRYLKTKNLALPVGYDVVDVAEDGKEVALPFRYERMVKLLQVVATNPDVETVIIDSATILSDMLIAHTLRMQGKAAMEINSWGFYMNYWKNLISQLATMKKNVILICHERVEKDDMDGSLKYFILVPGQMGNIMGALFTDVWRAEVDEKPGNPPTYNFQLRTMPSFRYVLKNSMSLPPVFKFDWKVIAEKLSA